ncbi:MAG TPA: amidohydrolase family protein [Bacteroidia bacterium]|jgi:imidazolonepropionase-like amidohydrolase|nr:amidohydrolase family protein [Bacteroidia bacterium]
MKTTTSYLSLLGLLLACNAVAQNPYPALPQKKSILILNGTAHLGNGKVIENSAIGFRDGKLDLVADATTIRLKEGAYDTTINAAGKQVYPGLIAANTTLGLIEIEAVRATVDSRETGSINPNVRAGISFNSDSRVPPTVRCNGVLMAQIAPHGGLLSGTSSVLELDGWNWEDMAYRMDDGVFMTWPKMNTRNYTDDGPGPLVQNSEFNKQVSDLHKFFEDAKAYCEGEKPQEKNLRFEAMRKVFSGSQNLYVRADLVKEITESIAFAKSFGIKNIIIVGGRDSWMCTATLKENNVSVMIGRIHSLPERNDDDVDLPFKTPYLLHKAGILYCINLDGDQEFQQNRNLPFNAGTTAAYGLTKEEALQSVTLDAARILGIDKTVGSLESGKDATLFISTGDALDMRGNNLEFAFIRGKKLDLNNEQKGLYERYKKKYGQK